MTAAEGPSTDLSALTRIAHGDAAAFAQLVAEYQPLVYRWALTLAADPDDADDVVQETFVTVHRKLECFDESGPFIAWLYAITRRSVAQRWRVSTRRKKLLEANTDMTRDVYVTDPGARVDRSRAIALIRESFKLLPQKQREAFDLVDLQGHTPAEAAELTGAKAVTIRAHLFKARSAIRARILSQHPLYDA
ncbi:MAG: sigma-70 family RNA polymerase sigma factor [Gemmatimonadaceae bacterium]|nr:sigma-70 family RNA polymerase sigma factor [Gemmatimonadaceae bacterium]